MRDLAFIVPAYNEQGSIGSVVQDLRTNYPEATVIVVNDGSLDGTAAEARTAGAAVLHMPYNVGIGGAVQTGFLYAHRHGFQYAVQVDGDGQHPAAEARQLIEAVVAARYNVVVGSRFVGDRVYRMPFSRRLGSKVLAVTIAAVSGRRIRDCTSGFRAYDRKALAFFAASYPQDYPEPEAIVLSARADLSMGEVAVQMNHRTTGVSSINMWRSVYYMIKTSLAIILKGLGAPREAQKSHAA